MRPQKNNIYNICIKLYKLSLYYFILNYSLYFVQFIHLYIVFFLTITDLLKRLSDGCRWL